MNKIKSNKGETLAETLISLLIICIAMLILLNCLNSAKKLITETDQTMNAYYDRNNELVIESNKTGTGTITFSLPIISNEKTLVVDYFVNRVYPNDPVVSYYRGK